MNRRERMLQASASGQRSLIRPAGAKPWVLRVCERVGVVAVGLAPGSEPAFAQSPRLVDPAGSGAIIGAVSWLEGTLLGTVATTVAVIAVAVVGMMMLTGRMNWRHGAIVILGCFTLFGAAGIVGGIQAAAQSN